MLSLTRMTTMKRAAPPSRTRIVLSMIVRNEERVIVRCLDAALPHVDGYVIVDTGSTDGTVKLVRAAAKRHGKPGRVIPHRWRNFGHNRTGAAESAVAWVKWQKWTLAETYLLFVDADMVLRAEPDWRPEMLTEPSYFVQQRNANLAYWNTRLARLSHEWQSVGVTHEFWRATPDVPPERLHALWIDDRGDGGSKAKKAERDIRLLTAGLEAEPTNVRYMFYLAQALSDVGRHAEAVRWYAKRRRTPDAPEECWFALYRMGLSRLAIGQEEEGAGTLLAAYQERPSRAEPLVALARHYRERSKNHTALMLARQAAQIPMPDDGLFVDVPAHTLGALNEISISACYAGTKAEGMAACEKILARRDVPDWQYDQTARNATFYLENFPALREGTFPIPLGLDLKHRMVYAGANPSIVELDPGFPDCAVHVRLVNYTQRGGRIYTAPNEVFRTRGAMLRWDASEGAVLTAPVEIEAPLPEGWPDARIGGLEDCRWVQHAGRVWFTATCCQVPGAGGWPRVVLGLMSPDLARVERVVKLDYGQTGPESREKNWVPWSCDGKLLLIYSYDPFVVVRVDAETGACSEAQRWTPPFRATRWKGSTAPVRMQNDPNRWLLLVHETAYMVDSKGDWEYSIYSHRWVVVSRSGMQVTAYSAPFRFTHSGVEYACGLLARGGKLVVTWGFEDREARWSEYDFGTVRESLSAVPGR